MEAVADVPLASIQGSVAADLHAADGRRCGETTVRRIAETQVGEAGVGDDPQPPILLTDKEDSDGGRREPSKTEHATVAKTLQKVSILTRALP